MTSHKYLVLIAISSLFIILFLSSSSLMNSSTNLSDFFAEAPESHVYLFDGFSFRDKGFELDVMNNSLNEINLVQ
jgi:hypothetical protein